MNTTSFKNRIVIVLFAIATILTSDSLFAQRSSGDVGIGVVFGQPTSLAVKVYKPKSSLDFQAAWDLDEFFFLNIHKVYDSHLNDQETLHFFYGPGAFVGIRDNGVLDDDVALGVSGLFGVDLLIDKFEVFVQAVPRLELIEATDFDMGGGVGFRVYF